MERWQGTSDLGQTMLGSDMKEPFQSRFVKKNGGDLEGVALGASSDTVSLCWCLSQVEAPFPMRLESMPPVVTHMIISLRVTVGTQLAMAHSKRND